MATARFRVVGKFDGASEATVVINRSSGVVSVRPLRRRRTYELPLADVAERIVWRIVTAEAAEKRKRKGARRG